MFKFKNDSWQLEVKKYLKKNWQLVLGIVLIAIPLILFISFLADKTGSWVYWFFVAVAGSFLIIHWSSK